MFAFSASLCFSKSAFDSTFASAFPAHCCFYQRLFFYHQCQSATRSNPNQIKSLFLIFSRLSIEIPSAPVTRNLPRRLYDPPRPHTTRPPPFHPPSLLPRKRIILHLQTQLQATSISQLRYSRTNERQTTAGTTRWHETSFKWAWVRIVLRERDERSVG